MIISDPLHTYNALYAHCSSDGMWQSHSTYVSGFAGDAHSAALTSNGFLFMWGSNEKGQLGLPAAADVAAQASVSPFLCLHEAVSLILSDLLCGLLSSLHCPVH